MSKGKVNYICYVVLIFFLGAFLGKVFETILYLVLKQKLINTGSLFGPWIPIYGIGAIILYYLKPLKKNPILLFIAAMFLSGGLEYITGLVLDKVFHMRLWEYKNMFLNIQGYICFLSVLSFGICGLLFNYLVQPLFDKLYNEIKFSYIKYSTIILTVIFIIDFILSKLYKDLPLT